MTPKQLLILLEIYRHEYRANGFNLLFLGRLSGDNQWIKLSGLITWDWSEEIYAPPRAPCSLGNDVNHGCRRVWW